MSTKITVSVVVNATLEKAWTVFTQPAFIVQWNAASDDWHCPKAENNLEVGSTFSYTMAARDGSFSFDFGGEYTAVETLSKIAYVLGDSREVEITFKQVENGVEVIEIFDPENQNPLEMQQMGWQAILNRYKAVAESN